MSAKAIVVWGILGVLVAMAIVIFMPKSCQTMTTEGFTSDTVAMCPSGTKSFVDINGNVNCCYGHISGNKCEGAIKCTFSGSEHRYPMCNTQKLKKQYTGEIPEWLNTWANNNRDPLPKVIRIMEDFGPTIKQIPSTNLPDSVKNTYFELIKEEKERAKQIYSVFEPNTSKPNFDINIWRQNEAIDFQQYQKEDIMYIINRLTSMLAQAPKLQSSPIVQQQIKAQICK
jgi:hypothetical protein